MRPRSLLAGLGATLEVAAVPALASDPSSGTVSFSAPKVEWTGTSNAYGAYVMESAATTDTGRSAPCDAPACDRFALEVADPGDLALWADNDHAGGPGNDEVKINIVKPDGDTRSSRPPSSRSGRPRPRPGRRSGP